MGSLVAQDNRTTPLLVLQYVNWATTDRENREVNRKSKIYRIDIQQLLLIAQFSNTKNLLNIYKKGNIFILVSELAVKILHDNKYMDMM